MLRASLTTPPTAGQLGLHDDLEKDGLFVLVTSSHESYSGKWTVGCSRAADMKRVSEGGVVKSN